MPAIYASLRSANFDEIDPELLRLKAAGVDALHLDVMDGKFCDEVSLPLEQVRGLRPKTDLPMDVHLMVERPEAAVSDWIALGVQRIAIHLEACPDPGPVLDQIRAGRHRARAGDPADHPGRASRALARRQVEFVNPLGVDPVAKTGYDESTPDRIRQLKVMKPGLTTQADGGVWEKTRDALVEAGADELVGGYPIFSRNDYELAVEELRSGA